MGCYNRERIYCTLKCSLSLRAFAVLMFLWLFHARLLVFVCVLYIGEANISSTHRLISYRKLPTS